MNKLNNSWIHGIIINPNCLWNVALSHVHASVVLFWKYKPEVLRWTWLEFVVQPSTASQVLAEGNWLSVWPASHSVRGILVESADESTSIQPSLQRERKLDSACENSNLPWWQWWEAPVAWSNVSVTVHKVSLVKTVHGNLQVLWFSPGCPRENCVTLFL